MPIAQGTQFTWNACFYLFFIFCLRLYLESFIAGFSSTNRKPITSGLVCLPECVLAYELFSMTQEYTSKQVRAHGPPLNKPRLLFHNLMFMYIFCPMRWRYVNQPLQLQVCEKSGKREEVFKTLLLATRFATERRKSKRTIPIISFIVTFC